MMRKVLLAMVGAVMVMGQAPVDSWRPLAERYVRLVLAVGLHDPDYVDAFYGPDAWREDAKNTPLALDEIDRRAEALIADIAAVPAPAGPRADAELRVLRRQYLERQLAALRARVSMLQGTRLSFDAESRALYDAVAPRHTEKEFEEVLGTLDAALPNGNTKDTNDGPQTKAPAPGASLIERLDQFRSAFIIPPDRVDRVFREAVRACRDRTRRYVDLPSGESFTIEYVTQKSWSGYNWYQGEYRSLIQINVDLPIYVDRALDLACHEGYPGHHVYNVLLEQHLVRDRGWIEFTVYPLFSPQSLIAEGTANYGIEVAFPREERLAYERDVLFPLAGLEPARAREYYEVLELVDRLSYAGNEAARRYLDGEIDQAAAVAWLERYALMSRPRAEQRVRFFDQYRSYVINYNLGKDLVKAYLDRRTRSDRSPSRLWREFTALLSSPRLPSGLK